MPCYTRGHVPLLLKIFPTSGTPGPFGDCGCGCGDAAWGEGEGEGAGAGSGWGGESGAASLGVSSGRSWQTLLATSLVGAT